MTEDGAGVCDAVAAGSSFDATASTSSTPARLLTLVLRIRPAIPYPRWWTQHTTIASTMKVVKHNASAVRSPGGCPLRDVTVQPVNGSPVVSVAERLYEPGRVRRSLSWVGPSAYAVALSVMVMSEGLTLSRGHVLVWIVRAARLR